tara:strand:- start:4379 stop:4813 length:435 start_codon:yes stop_codon:yes gene_type:complete
MQNNIKNEYLQEIFHKDTLLALILRTEFNKDGIQFFTPDNFSQQLGYMKRPTGYIIDPHIHNPVIREVEYTKEVLFIKSGLVKIDFYSQNKDYLQSEILKKGDIILLSFGGHGFTMLEESEIIEVKQGPYAGESDKSRFKGINQ